MSKLEKKKLFRPEVGNDSPKMLIGADTNNIMMLSSNKYDWSFKMYKTMMQNFWIPETISLSKDKQEYEALSIDEQDTFDKIISFLIFLDSLQTANLPNINDYVTIPEVNLLINIQTYQEALHSQSYGYILESVIPPEKRKSIYDIAIKDEFLLRRNKIIADQYEEFINEQNDRGFVKVMMSNFILEGLFFFLGFAFFYNLARNGKMTGVATEIKYINKDEFTHMALFQGMFRELRKEKPELFSHELEVELRDMMRKAVEEEVTWSKYAIGNRIQGINEEMMEGYIKYISNYRLRAIGLEPLYPECTKDTMPFINQFTEFNNTKTNFFEEKVTNYVKDSGTLKLDDLDDVDF
jgi:ribonucleoside-diphosphate reductase beta chain